MKIQIKIKYLLFAFVLQTLATADTTFTDQKYGISMYLPDNWIAVKSNDSQYTFYDSSDTYQSSISIIKHVRNVADYPASDDWTRAHLIAYLLVTQYSYDPFGAVLYFDSSSSCKQDSLWAPEAFSEFYTIDTALGAWDEYMKFTAAGGYGYEMYAIGDTSDMKENVSTYAALIELIKILDNGTPVVHRSLPLKQSFSSAANSDRRFFDLLGKKVTAPIDYASGIYCRKSLNQVRIFR